MGQSEVGVNLQGLPPEAEGLVEATRFVGIEPLVIKLDGGEAGGSNTWGSEEGEGDEEESPGGGAHPSAAVHREPPQARRSALKQCAGLPTPSTPEVRSFALYHSVLSRPTPPQKSLARPRRGVLFWIGPIPGPPPL